MWSKRGFHYLILILLASIWGSSFILIKIGLKAFSNYQVAAIRICSASLFLLPFSIKNLRHLQKSDFLNILKSGLFGSMIPAILFATAQTNTTSSVTGILNSFTPIATLIMGVLFYKTKLRKVDMLGLVFGFLGATILITRKAGFSLASINGYALLIIMAAFCYAFNLNHSKTKLGHLSGFQLASLSFFMIGPIAMGYLLFSDFSATMAYPQWSTSLLAVCVLGVFGSAIAWSLGNALIRHTSAFFSSATTFIMPIFAILWGLLDNEVVTWVHLICLLLILSGLYFIGKKEN